MEAGVLGLVEGRSSCIETCKKQRAKKKKKRLLFMNIFNVLNRFWQFPDGSKRSLS